MIISLKKHAREKQLAGRPDYYKKWNEATSAHMSSYQIVFRQRMDDLRDAKESM